MNKKIRVLLADDHETVRDGIRAIIDMQPDMEVIAATSDGRTAVLEAQKAHPDVAVMDVSMPQMNGLKATQRLAEVCPKVKVLMLTRHADDSYLQSLLSAGAMGYVLKQSASAELVHAIRAVVAGGTYLDPSITSKVLRGYTGKAISPVAYTGSLTDRELEVMKLIAWGYSNKEIAGRLGLSVKTVEVHKSNSMKKLNMHSRVDIVKYALLKGWLQDN
ncbi:MAG TPA: response regulator transcription factor [Blastocatellia bacterium]|nr:response regulator transcription factor [Blastocatellia bacterium]